MTQTTERVSGSRIRSVDLLRGIVIVVMALDHVRDYWSITPFAPMDPEQTTLAYAFTRLITHYCAPVFILLAGTSAFLYQRARSASAAHLSRFLLTRGLWLMVIEITIVSASWQFFYAVTILQVIWAIGLSMVVMAGLVFLPRPAILVFGLALIFGHNAFDGVEPGSGIWGLLWQFLHVPAFLPVADAGFYMGINIGYPLIPWVGVMALGYAAAPILFLPPERRDRLLLVIGGAAIGLFLVLRGLNLYGDPNPWSPQERGPAMTLVSFFGVQKYPPSLHYLLLTLGPALMAIPFLERWGGAMADRISVFGKVPFFFYILHIPLIHATAWIWQFATLGGVILNPFDPTTWPEGYAPNLPLAYLAWAGTVFVLYWPCKWFAGLKTRRKDWWLSYL